MDDKKETKFWMVWCIERGSPTARHGIRATADQEAQRLASKHPEQNFYVMEAKQVFRGIVAMQSQELA